MTKATQALIASLNANAQERVAYEESKNAASSNVINNLIKQFKLDRKTFETTHNDAYFKNVVATKFVRNFDFINNSVKSTARFNTYALAKAALKIECVSRDKLIKETALDNKFCVAAVLTCLQNRDKEQFTFSRQHALAMLSKALRFEHVATSELATKFNVAASTAATQVSSSFRVLEALDILKFDDSSRDRCIVSAVNYDNAFVKLVARHYQIDIA